MVTAAAYGASILSVSIKWQRGIMNRRAKILVGLLALGFPTFAQPDSQWVLEQSTLTNHRTLRQGIGIRPRRASEIRGRWGGRAKTANDDHGKDLSQILAHG
jgi:hypothetical protein